MAGMSSLTATVKLTATLQAANNLAPAAASPIQNNSALSKSLSLGTAAPNNTVGGADEAALFITSVTASSNANVNFASATDLLNTSGISLARIKAIILQLLSAADDATNGNACSSVTVGNNGANDWISQSFSGWFNSAASKMDIPNGAVEFFGTPAAGGVLVDGTHFLLHLANNDGANTAKVQTTLIAGST